MGSVIAIGGVRGFYLLSRGQRSKREEADVEEAEEKTESTQDVVSDAVDEVCYIILHFDCNGQFYTSEFGV